MTGAPDQFRYVCKDIEGDLEPQSVIHVQVGDVDAPHHFNKRVLSVENDPQDLGRNFELAMYNLERLDADHTRVHIAEGANNLSILALILLHIGNPPRDYLLQLKATCEGTPDLSYASWLMRDF